METGKQGQGSGYSGGSGQQASMGKGLDSFRDNPQLAQQIVREGYIQQAGNSGDVESIRTGAWDNKIPGFELATHVLQNATDLVGKVPQTS
jgi:hypothetical protein